MTSFKEKLKNLINDSLGRNKNINLEQSINQSIISTQRKINKDISYIITEKNSPIKRNNLKSQFKNFSINNDLYTNNNKNKNKNNKINLYNNKLNIEKLTLNDIIINYKYDSDNFDINKEYKNLYNKSIINNNNNVYNKNKTYLNYKNINNNKYNDINKNNIYKFNNTKSTKILINNTSLSSKKLLNKNDININRKINSLKIINSNVKPNNLFGEKKQSSFDVYDKLINNKDVLITKNKNRINNSMRKKINLFIGENGLNNVSYRNNIVNKMPRILNSELFQIDNTFYNNISPLKKFSYLNNEKNKNNYKKYYNDVYLNNNNNNSSKNLSLYN